MFNDRSHQLQSVRDIDPLASKPPGELELWLGAQIEFERQSHAARGKGRAHWGAPVAGFSVSGNRRYTAMRLGYAFFFERLLFGLYRSEMAFRLNARRSAGLWMQAIEIALSGHSSRAHHAVPDNQRFPGNWQITAELAACAVSAWSLQRGS